MLDKTAIILFLSTPLLHCLRPAIPDNSAPPDYLLLPPAEDLSRKKKVQENPRISILNSQILVALEFSTPRDASACVTYCYVTLVSTIISNWYLLLCHIDSNCYVTTGTYWYVTTCTYCYVTLVPTVMLQSYLPLCYIHTYCYVTLIPTVMLH